jgi:glycosyltransferase involved in cell wall biosynthesis
MFSAKIIFSLPYRLFKSLYTLKRELKNESIDIVYSSTLAVIMGLVYSVLYRVKHIWHVHELIRKPRIVKHTYTYLLSRFSNHVVFNSHASRNNFIIKTNKLSKKATVIWNGLERQSIKTKPETLKKLRKSLTIKETTIVIGLVGRISHWKGHRLLLEAFEDLHNNGYDIALLFLGSPPPNQEHFLETLIDEIKKRNLSHKCSIVGFDSNIWQYFDLMDIVTVPSTEPEPFGLVTLEAMLSKKPVIASNHGGLSEIVVDNHTGFLFSPNSSGDLYLKTELLIKDKNKRNNFGKNGYDRVNTIFTSETYNLNLLNCIKKL